MEGLKLLKVLYVEDEVVTRSRVASFLKKKVGKLIIGENGKDGIEKFHQYNPDIIITDLVMGDMSGIEMMKQIRSKGYKCPVIITSALSDSKTIIETVDLKIEKYIIKPVDLDELLKALWDIAIEEFEKNKSLIAMKGEFVLEEKQKKELELELRNVYSSYLKKVTGKGAVSINVFIKGKEIEILSKGNLTQIEESFLKSGTFFKTIEILRKTVYENTKSDIESSIENVIGRRVSFERVEVYPKKKYEISVFKIY